MRRAKVTSDPSLELLTIPFDNRAFESVLERTPNDVASWLWQIAEAINPVYVFMPGGGDVSYFERGERTDVVLFKQLPRLINEGEVAVVHPIMYLAERLGQGSVCKKAEGAPWSHVEHRAGLGCLLMLADRDAATGALEIREPVGLYDRLRAYFG